MIALLPFLLLPLDGGHRARTRSRPPSIHLLNFTSSTGANGNAAIKGRWALCYSNLVMSTLIKTRRVGGCNCACPTTCSRNTTRAKAKAPRGIGWAIIQRVSSRLDGRGRMKRHGVDGRASAPRGAGLRRGRV